MSDDDSERSWEGVGGPVVALKLNESTLENRREGILWAGRRREWRRLLSESEERRPRCDEARDGEHARGKKPGICL